MGIAVLLLMMGGQLVVVVKTWQPPVSALSFTALQFTAGGLILLPLALIVEPPLLPLTVANLAGLTWLGLIADALTYAIWFRGGARLEPGAVSMLGMMSPVTAVILGWIVLTILADTVFCFWLLSQRKPG